MALQTQQVVTSSFFKPQTSHFTLGSVSSSSLRQQQQPLSIISTQYKRQQPQRVTTSSQYFKTNSNVVQRKNTQKELEQTSCDRMETLHSRLQMEAEKIRKWKNATEVELKQKEKCLEEANQTIDTQRTTLTDLQLKNESLASRLRDEVANQKEIQKKICSTRDMCTALKDHTLRLDEALYQTENDKTSLIQLDTDRKHQFQALLDRFKELEHGQTEWQRVHKEALLAEQTKSSQLSGQCDQFQQQLEQALTKISHFESKCTCYETSISQLNGELSTKNTQCDVLCKEKADLQHGLCARDNDVSTLEGKLDELEQQLATVKHCLSEKEQELCAAQQNILDNNALHSDQLASVNSTLTTEQARCKKLEDTQSDLKAKLEEVTAHFTEQCKSLSTQLDEATEQLAQSQQCCNELEEVLSKEKEIRSELESEKSQLGGELTKVGSELTALRERMDREIEKKEEDIKNVQSELAEANGRYQSASKEWEKGELELQEKVVVLESERGELSERMSLLNCQLDESKTTFEEERRNTKEQMEKYEARIVQLESEKVAVFAENTNFKQQIELLTEKEVSLSAQCSDLNQLRKEEASLKDSLKLQSATVDKLNKELSMVQDELNMKCRELSVQVEVYKKEATTSKLEHENAKRAFDSQVNDLCATLERYTAESQKTISHKDKAIESLKKQLQESDVVKRSTESELHTFQNKVELLQEELSTKNQEIKELFEAVECLKRNVHATPVRNTPTLSHSITPLHSAYSTPMDNIVVSSTPKAPVSKTTPATPKSRSRPPISLIPSTPSQNRVYNYRVSSSQLNRSRPAPPCTPRNTSRAKRMCYQEDTEERTKFKELYPDKETEDEEAVFKKPKPKGVTVRIASSTTNNKALTSNTATRRPLANRNGRDKRGAGKRNTGKKSSEDLSWFELDSVYGFGPND